MVDDEAAREIVADLEKQEEERKAEEAKKEENRSRRRARSSTCRRRARRSGPTTRKFVSEHDSSVEHETQEVRPLRGQRAPGRCAAARRRRRGRRRPSGDGRLAMRTPDLGQFLRGARRRRGRRRAPGGRAAAYGAPDPGSPEQGGASPSWARSAQPRPGGGGARGGTGPSLMPSEQQLARAIGGGTQDALQDIDDGDETALNSKRWRFASFFNRVKRQVAEHWHPEEVVSPARSDRDRVRRTEPLHRAAHPAQARRAAEQRGAAQPSGSSSSTTRRSRRSRRRSRSRTRRASSSRTGTINFGFGFLFDLNGPPQMRWFRYNY